MRILPPLILLLTLSNCWATTEHKVQKGDHVITILQQYDYPMQSDDQLQHWLAEIKRLNEGKFIWGEIDLIKPGSTLVLPEKPSAPKTVPIQMPVVTAEIDSPVEVGTLFINKGEASIKNASGHERRVSKTTRIYEGDRITTQAKSRVELSMIDKAKFELGANTKITINQYHYKPKEPKSSNTLMRFSYGVLRTTTGLVGKYAPEKFNVRTPVTTIGIRGTDYVARHCEGKECGDYSGSSLAVIEGGISASNEKGSVDLNKGEFVAVYRSGEISDVQDIPEGFLNIDNSVSQLESPLNWWQSIKKQLEDYL